MYPDRTSSNMRVQRTRRPLGSGSLNVALAAALLSLACSKDKPAAQGQQVLPKHGQMKLLSSGRRVNVTSIDHLSGELGPTLAFHFTSSARPGDIPALQREVDDVWSDLQRQADREKVAAVLIVPEQGDGTSTGFVVRREADGTWRKSSGLWAR
jgi:hypothetical protein